MSVWMMLQAAALSSYGLQDVMEGHTFFDAFDFFTDADPTHGHVAYSDRATCARLVVPSKPPGPRARLTRAQGIINSTSTSAYMGVDLRQPQQAPRASVRLSSKKVYNGGLFVADIRHMPAGCGTWPAFWLASGSLQAARPPRPPDTRPGGPVVANARRD